MLRLRTLTLGALCVPWLVAGLFAQGGRGGPQSEAMRAAMQALREGRETDALAAVRREAAANPTSTAAANLLDTLGVTTEARTIFHRIANTATDGAVKAAALRGIAMSYAFDGDCASTVKYEEMVIAYWVSREQAEPQNAFYQQGEMANEAARVCIDHGQLDVAETYYRRGRELGLKEPAPRTHPVSLWDYRTAHALARLAARRGNAAEASKHIAEARRILDSDRTMAEAQERFFPYLTGYVALYLNDLKKAQADLGAALAAQGNGTDPFMHWLLATADEKDGQPEKAQGLFEKAYGLATAHNPPAAFVRPALRKAFAR